MSRWRILLVESKDGKKFYSTDSQISEIGYFVNQPRICTALGSSDTRVRMPGESADMHLVYDRFCERSSGRHVLLPIVIRRICGDALERCCYIRPWSTRM